MDSSQSWDPGSRLESLVLRYRVCEGALRDLLQSLSHQLPEACSEREVPYSGKLCTLCRYGEQRFVYGYFSFDGQSLAVQYRTTDNDLCDQVELEPSAPRYLTRSLAESPLEWLRSLVVGESLGTLVSSMMSGSASNASRPHSAVKAIEQAASSVVFAQFCFLERLARQLHDGDPMVPPMVCSRRGDVD